MSEDIHDKERWKLLQNLRSTVEGLLIDGVSNVWNVYGGLNRLHNIMELIFKHGCRIFDRCGEPDCWIFIQGLNWLQPALATSPVPNDNRDYLANLPIRISSKKDMLWLYKSLESHTLSNKLSWLLSDKEHMLSCLEPWAFLCQENLAEAALLCLRAVEKNQPTLLTELDVSLFVRNWMPFKNNTKAHKRSSSYPTNLSMNEKSKINNLKKQKDHSVKELTEESILQIQTLTIKPENEKSKDHSLVETDNESALKTWNSLPVLNKKPQKVTPSSSTLLSQNNDRYQPSTSCEQSSPPIQLSEIININYSELNSKNESHDQSTTKPRTPTRKTRSKMKPNKTKENEQTSSSSDTLNYENSASGQPIPVNEIPSVVNIPSNQSSKRKTSFLAGSAPEITSSWGSEIEGQKTRTSTKSFIEDGGNSVQPMATGYFPRPFEGQSLTSFLSSEQFSRSNAELDRENAHFSISEAMIAVIERVKCNHQWNLSEEYVEESDEEINRLKRKIRIRRKQRQEEQSDSRIWNRELCSDGKTTDTTTTDQSISPQSTSSDTQSGGVLSDEEMDDVLGENHDRAYESSISLSSDVELHKSSLTESVISAEGVALSLISKFREHQLPRASDLQWIVSEKDAPQQLLPLPKSWLSGKNDTDGNDQGISLRGTVEWAPPRPQIIFTLHPPPVKKVLLAKQNYICAGCGMKVAQKYASRFRYCEYLGRYFCTGCHTNQVTLIPAKILWKWDFKRYPVSNFCYRLLDRMMLDALFNINDVNPNLYRRIKHLEKTKILRTQISYLKDFIFNCRFEPRIQSLLKKEPDYLFVISHIHEYSIQDLEHVKLGILTTRLQELFDECCKHVSECALCQGRGWVCELCNTKDIIFPWELSKVSRCESCGGFFHAICSQRCHHEECRRCKRLQKRQISRQKSPPNETDC